MATCCMVSRVPLAMHFRASMVAANFTREDPVRGPWICRSAALSVGGGAVPFRIR